MIDAQLKELLICPKCHGELDFRHHQESQPTEDHIHCKACHTQYPVAGKIPLMFSAATNDGFGHDLYHAQLRGNFFERVFHNNRINTLLRLIADELPRTYGIHTSGMRVLDVGCNTGPMLIPMRQRGYDVIGVDISLEDVQQAEGYLQTHNLGAEGLSVADGTRLPFRDQSFDLVLLIDILEHTDRPQHIVSEATRLLAPGGIAVATVPWAFHPYVRYTWLRKLLSSRKTIDEHPDAPFKLNMLQSLFSLDGSTGSMFEPLFFRLVFHWVCILGVYRRTKCIPMPAGSGKTTSINAGQATAVQTPDTVPVKEPILT